MTPASAFTGYLIGRSLNPARGDEGYNLFTRIESENASLQVWLRNSARSSAEGSGEGGSSPVLHFVEESLWEDQSLVVEGQHALKLSDKATLHSILTYNRYEIDPTSRYVFPVAGALFLDDFKYGLGTSTSLEEKVDYDVSESTRLMFGVAGTSYNVIPKTTVLGGADTDDDIVSQAGVLRYYTVANDANSLVEINRAVDLHYQQLGFYVEGSHHFTDYLRLILGARVDMHSRYDATPISPRAALVYTGADNRLTLKYIYSEAFVSPAPYFAYNVFDNGTQISSGNGDLKPERATSNEINATWQDHNLLASASVYDNQQKDLILTSQTEAPETAKRTGPAPRMAASKNPAGRSTSRRTNRECVSPSLFLLVPDVVPRSGCARGFSRCAAACRRPSGRAGDRERRGTSCGR